MGNGYNYGQDEWAAETHRVASRPQGSARTGHRREILWAFRGALVVILVAVCTWFFVYGNREATVEVQPPNAASEQSVNAETSFAATEQTSEPEEPKESTEEEDIAERCERGYWPGGFRNPALLYCDGDWMRVGEKQTDDLVVYQWVNGDWQEYEPHGKTATGFDCFNSADMRQDGVPTVLRTDIATCDGGTSESASRGARSGTSTCGGLTGEEAVYTWIDRLPDSGVGSAWSPDFVDTEGYNPCAALSYIPVTVESATAASPYHIMLFHYGEYLGTATLEAYAFAPIISRDSDSSITVNYKYLRNNGESHAEASGRTTAHYRWDEGQGKVVMTGSAPPCSGRPCD
ncbi:LppP/LprE family lipoprotein [Corynebacterium mastitidis]|uniref:LppP/LprE family lipoprotein n=1 Tax=Corynebacterium mastitidis TaxID=161890 RepID=A0ABU8NW67_9CORY